jgi:hypothetical protein
MEFLGGDIDCRIWSSLPEARIRALGEMVNVGGVCMEVYSVSVRRDAITIVGRLSARALDYREHERSGRAQIASGGAPSFHLTWSSLLQPSGVLGFIVLRRPVVLTGGAWSPQEPARVALEVSRRSCEPLEMFIGPACCVLCNGDIAPERLAALPDVRTCVNCQRQRETAASRSRNGKNAYA